MFEGDDAADRAITAAQHWERIAAHAQAQQYKAIAEFARVRRHPGGVLNEFTADEIAVALGISTVAAGHRLSMALSLTQRLPATLEALERGEIDQLRARAIVDGTQALSPQQAAQVETGVLVRAGEQTAPQLRQAVKRAVLRVDPHGGQARHQQERQRRKLVLSPAEDGMAELWAYLPAAAASAVYETVHDCARRSITPGDDRTADQRRADALVDLVLGQASGPAAQVHVTVPASSLLGLANTPGELAGYGPIPAGVARELAADATWRRLLTDPASGTLLDYGRTTYRPPAALADFVRARDKTCRFPGCRRAAHKCELDHQTPYPHGPTSADNLGLKCRHHHRLKHRTAWRTTRLPNGDWHWTSPTGRHYTVPAEEIGEPAAPIDGAIARTDSAGTTTADRGATTTTNSVTASTDSVAAITAAATAATDATTARYPGAELAGSVGNVDSDGAATADFVTARFAGSEATDFAGNADPTRTMAAECTEFVWVGLSYLPEYRSSTSNSHPSDPGTQRPALA